MGGGDLRTDAGFALRHDGEGKSDYADAIVEYGVGEPTGECRVIEHDGRDGMGALDHYKLTVFIG